MLSRRNSNLLKQRGRIPCESLHEKVTARLRLSLTVMRACGFGKHRVIFCDCDFEVEVHSAVFQG
jgi:hypothetical protein